MDDQGQLAWLASAVDALEGITAQEIAHVSAEVRRSVTRHNQIVPEIARLVAEMRSRRAKEREWAARPPLPVYEVKPQPPLTQAEISRMPKWLKDTGLRVGFLRRVDDLIVDVSAA